MSLPRWLLHGFGVVLAIYILALVAAGRRSDARALAGFIPDCLILVTRLLGDPRVPRRRKLLLGLLVAYLAMPLDLVPDFIPVAGQLDDAILVAVVLRAVQRSGGEELLREHWSGPPRTLEVVRRLAYGNTDGQAVRGQLVVADRRRRERPRIVKLDGVGRHGLLARTMRLGDHKRLPQRRQAIGPVQPPHPARAVSGATAASGPDASVSPAAPHTPALDDTQSSAPVLTLDPLSGRASVSTGRTHRPPASNAPSLHQARTGWETPKRPAHAGHRQSTDVAVDISSADVAKSTVRIQRNNRYFTSFRTRWELATCSTAATAPRCSSTP